MTASWEGARLSAVRSSLTEALVASRGNVAAAARSLGVSARTVFRWVDRLGLADWLAALRLATLAVPRHECHGGPESTQVPETTEVSPLESTESPVTRDS